MNPGVIVTLYVALDSEGLEEEPTGDPIKLERPGVLASLLELFQLNPHEGCWMKSTTADWTNGLSWMKSTTADRTAGLSGMKSTPADWAAGVSLT